jgi:hypothetical protein
MSLEFIDLQGKLKLTLKPGDAVPPNMKPNIQYAGYTVDYFMLIPKTKISLPSVAVPPTPSVYLGFKAPPKPTTTLPPSTQPPAIPSAPGVAPSPSVLAPPQPPATLDISRGGFYIAGETGNRLYLAPGLPIPPGWTPDVGTKEPEKDIPVADVPAAAAVVVQEEIPGAFENKSASNLLLWLKIAGVIGVAGISYVAYLAVKQPAAARYYINCFKEFKDLVVDSSQLLIGAGIMLTVGFVSYQFIAAYQDKGSVAAAIASMTADTIEVLVLAIVDTIEQLAKDAWDFVWGEVKSVVPSWL